MHGQIDARQHNLLLGLGPVASTLGVASSMILGIKPPRHERSDSLAVCDDRGLTQPPDQSGRVDEAGTNDRVTIHDLVSHSQAGAAVCLQSSSLKYHICKSLYYVSMFSFSLPMDTLIFCIH